MKKLKIPILASALMLSCIITSTAQTADDIIQKHIAAMGGADNWKKITSVRMKGVINTGVTKIPVMVTTLQGKGQKVEFTFNGMTGYTILTPTAGWAYNPAQDNPKPEAMPREMIKQGQGQLDIPGPLIDYKAKGNKVAYAGKGDVEGTKCYKLQVTYADGKEETMYIDTADYYHIRSVEKINARGDEEEKTSTFGNYQKLPEGILWPMSIDDGSGPVDLNSVEVNIPVDESFFKPGKE